MRTFNIYCKECEQAERGEKRSGERKGEGRREGMEVEGKRLKDGRERERK